MGLLPRTTTAYKYLQIPGKSPLHLPPLMCNIAAKLTAMAKDPIVNCHTHVFTGDHVPPYIAKTYVPPPFHLLLPLSPLVKFFRWWYKGPGRKKYLPPYKKREQLLNRVNILIEGMYPFNIIMGYILFLFAFFQGYSLLSDKFPPENNLVYRIIHTIYTWLDPVMPDISDWLKITLLIVILFCFKTIRRFVLLVFSLLWKVLKAVPGSQTKEMFLRYLNIGRYAFHLKQKTIFSKLHGQYPDGTGFIILPMDMDYMEAGNSKTRYRDQMAELAELKKEDKKKTSIYPFLFADPRRFGNVTDEKRYQPGDKSYFEWELRDGNIALQDCFVKDYLENEKEDDRFSGIKIYPALGYYPFDAKLLPLWKYAADKGLPIMTHCIKGTIFYRGRKKEEWNTHPIYEQAMGKASAEEYNDGYKDDEDMDRDPDGSLYCPLVLPQNNNVDFSYNFTHPMNYLCLLEEPLLRKIIHKEVKENGNTQLGELFGYEDENTELTSDLRNLKICLAHFGGDDEWKRYFEKDRYDYSSQLAKNPDAGIDFLKKVDGSLSRGKPEHLWKYTDWYSIICSMMLRYPNIYADISYILHSSEDILPLLKQTLQNDKLKGRVLYGTDFFVVRNHKSDKNLLADMHGGLSEEMFDQIARKNPKEYLKNELPDAV